ncbi:VCBS repeat-containing protein/40-residue YVTN family beta-propeller repeat-containing protein [Mycolicibacterium rutilum]|uniref:VCBS repeat-containing protein/40-residue YVTN family beta-propeller repeat-containing protein n=1 Tax=Mycolicibacterium rutilum TaxID=370526 RepID=A0A1H6JQL7_MYCRU|nr:Ig-like domain-containing protein [Mycolicibacterium rutilum]SEH61361.1 VCBS repeat-containing protein/40-residue YVTN family beta-propeller repeat-containing protein [Mycolicibacterium rutilum]
MIQRAKHGRHRAQATKMIGAGTYARYVGRVGALAVALGVGTAIGVTSGPAWATPDANTADTTDAPAGANEAAPEPQPAAEVEPSPTAQTPNESQTTDTVNDGTSPPVTVSGSGGANTTVNGASPEDVEPAEEEPAPVDEKPSETLPRNDDPAPSSAAPTPPAPTSSAPTPDPTATPPTTDPKPPVSEPSPPASLSEPVASLENSPSVQTISAARTVEEPPQPTTVASQLVSLISPLLVPSPGTPAAPALVWAVLAFARRELEPTVAAPTATPQAQTLTSLSVEPTARAAAPNPLSALGNFLRGILPGLTNKPPNAAPQITAVDTSTGVVTGRLNATDANGDAITYTVRQPASGRVTVSETGQFTFTPTDAARHAASATAREDVTSFSVTLRDARGGTRVVTVRNVPITPSNSAPISGGFAVTQTNPSTGVVKGVVSADDPDDDRLTYKGTTTTAKGRVTVASNGSLTYTPTAAARHAAASSSTPVTDNFTVTVTDGHGGTLAVPVTVTIASANKAPQAGKATVYQPNSITGVVTGSVRATDADRDTLSYSGSTSTTKGTVVVQSNGDFTYTPTQPARQNAAAGGAAAKDTFMVTVSDGHGGTLAVPVTVTISPNRAPVAGTVNAPQPNPLTGVVTGSVTATDPDRDPVTYSGTGDTPKGHVVVYSDGKFTYTPTDDARADARTTPDTDIDTFSVTATDGRGATVSIPVNVLVAPEDRAPVVTAPTVGSPTTDGVVTGSLGVSDPDGTALTYQVITGPTRGTVQIDAGTGQYTYTPTDAARLQAALSTGVVETDTFTVRVSDGLNAPVTVTVSDIVVAELAVNSVIATPEVGEGPQAVVISPDGTRAYVANADGDSVTVLNTADHSTVGTITVGDRPVALALDSTGSVLYVANAGDGSVVAVDTASLTVGAPIAIGAEPTGIAVSPDGAFVFTTNTNDTLTIIDVASGETTSIEVDPLGIATSADGRFVYLANADESALTIIDRQTGDQVDVVVGDTPSGVVVSPTGDRVYVTVSGDDRVAVVDLSDGNSVTYIDVGDDPRGIDITGDGRLYVANYGSDNVAVVNTATGTVTFVAVGNGPTDVAINADGTQATVTNSLDNTVTVIVLTGNAAPDVVYTVGGADIADGATVVDFDATDPDGDVVSYSVTTNPVHGTVTNNGDGTFTYTPTAQARHDAAFGTGSLTDTFVVAVDDNRGQIVPVTVTVAIDAFNAAPVTADDFYTVDEDGSIIVSPLANDSDPDGDVLTYIGYNDPPNGTLVPLGDGRFLYTPNANFSGLDGFAYQPTDGLASGEMRLVYITVAPVDDAPVAVADAVEVASNDSVTFSPLDNDLDVDGDPLTIVSTTMPFNGTVTYSPDGTMTYVPDTNYVGTDTFTYVISDGTSQTVGTVTINVIRVNEAPSINPVTSAPVNGVVNIDLQAADPDGDELTYTVAGLPSKGTVSPLGNGVFVYTPTAAARSAAAATSGVDTDTFLVTVEDGQGGITQAYVTVEVAPTRVVAETDIVGTVRGAPAVSESAHVSVVTTTVRVDGVEFVNVTVTDTLTGRQVGETVTVPGTVTFGGLTNDVKLGTELTPEGTRAIVTTTNNVDTVWVTVIDTTTGQQVGETVAVAGYADPYMQRPARLNADGSRAVLTTVGAGRTTTHVVVIDTETGQQLGATIDVTGAPVDPQAYYDPNPQRFAGDGTRYVVTSYNGTDRTLRIVVVNTETGEQQGETVAVQGSMERALYFNADRTRLAVSGYSYSYDEYEGVGYGVTSTVLIDPINGGQIGDTVTLGGNPQPVIFSANGNRAVISARPGSPHPDITAVALVDTATGQQIGTDIAVPGDTTIALTADGSRIVFTGSTFTDTTVKVIDGATGGQLGADIVVSGWRAGPVALSPDGTRATVVTTPLDSSSGTGTLRVVTVDTADGTQVAGDSYNGPQNMSGIAEATADGSAIVVVTQDTVSNTISVSIVDTHSGAFVGTPVVVSGRWRDSQFSQDGTRAVVSTYDDVTMTSHLVLVDVANGAALNADVALAGFHNDPAVFSEDGTRLLFETTAPGATSSRQFTVLNTATGAAIVPGTTLPYESEVRMIGTGDRIVVAYNQGNASRLMVLDGLTGNQVGATVTLNSLAGQYPQVGISDDGRFITFTSYVSTAGGTGSATAFVDVNNGAQIGDTIISDKFAFSGGFDGTRAIVLANAGNGSSVQQTVVDLTGSRGGAGGSGGLGGNGGAGGSGGAGSDDGSSGTDSGGDSSGGSGSGPQTPAGDEDVPEEDDSAPGAGSDPRVPEPRTQD